MLLFLFSHEKSRHVALLHCFLTAGTWRVIWWCTKLLGELLIFSLLYFKDVNCITKIILNVLKRKLFGSIYIVELEMCIWYLLDRESLIYII